MLPLQAVAQSAAAGIVSCLVLGMPVAAVVWLMMRLLPSGSAGSRFAVWFSALGVIGLVPVAQNFLQASASGAARAASWTPGFVVLPAHWAWYVFGVWAVVAIVGFARVMLGAWHLRRLRSKSVAVEVSGLDPMVRETVLRVTRRRRFELRASDQVHVPMAIGFFRPAVIFPEYLLSELVPEQLNQLVLHEATHLLRYDDWTNLAQKLMQAVLFFHPAVWWLESKLTLEREMACDEAVVAETHNARSYAECLAVLAEKSVLRRSLALVQAAVSRLQHTSLRVKQVLAMEQHGRVRGWSAAASVVGVISCAAVLVQAPDLVSFQNRAATRALQSESNTVVGHESGAKAIPASLVSESSRVVPAVVRQEAAPGAVKKRIATRTNVVANRTVLRAFRHEPEREAHVVMAEQVNGPVPVLLMTTTVIESGYGGAEQMFVLRTWRVGLYYPGSTDQAKQETSHKI
jgi:beta-lactamase regulating signal transducer with metallopeptidase domain